MKKKTRTQTSKKPALKGGFEHALYEQFKWRKNVAYESEAIKYFIPKVYKPDLVITLKDGSKRYVEIKGWFRPEDVLKMQHVKNCNPEMDIRILFAKDNPIRTGAKMKYSDWCVKYGYRFHVGDSIPKDWFK